MITAQNQIESQTQSTQSTVILKFRPFYWLLLPAYLAFIFGLFIWSYAKSLPAFFRGIGTTPYLSDTPNLGWVLLGFGFIVVYSFFYVQLFRAYSRSRIEIHDTYLLKYPPVTLLHAPLEIDYSEIAHIAPDLHGTIRIKLASGKTHHIWAAGYEGGPESVLSHLSASVDPAAFQCNLSKQVKSWHWWDIVYYVTYVLGIGCIVSAFPLDLHSFRPQSLLGGWTTTAIFSDSHIPELLALDGNNNPYVLLDNGDFTAHILRHFTADGIKDLELPASVGLKFPQKMLVDSAGHVWISQFDADGILLVDGGNWRWIITGAGVEARISSIALAEDKIWIAARYTDGGDLAIIDTRSFSSQIAKFSDLVHSPSPINLFSLNELPDATLGALATSGNQVVVFRLESNGHWQEYSIANKSVDHLPYPFTFTIDRAGRPWLLSAYCPSAGSSAIRPTYIQIGPGDSPLAQPKEFTFDCSIFSEGFIRDSYVDQRNRLWAYNDGALDVFQIEASGSLTPLKTYPSYNSNYQISDFFPPTFMPITSKGVFWSIGDHGISTFDTSQEDLPATLPDWISSMLSDRGKLTNLLFGFGLFNLAIMFLTQRYVIWQYKSKSLELNPN